MMRILGLILVLSTLGAEEITDKNSLIYTRITLNYRIVSLIEKEQVQTSRIYDVHSGREIINAQIGADEPLLEEQYEDKENLLVIQYDFEGKLKSKKSFKKNGRERQEIKLSAAEIEAMQKYDVSDEELPIMKIDWEKLIFADENFSKDKVVRWSELRDFRVKTEYSTEGIIQKRIVFNKHTGQKLKNEARIYTQTVNKDIIQNHRGFLEVFYNSLGKISAIRAWDRLSGRVVPPPKSLPFSFRLEQDHLPLDYQKSKEFKKDYFNESESQEPIRIRTGESLFESRKRDYKVIQSISLASHIQEKVSGKISGSGVFNQPNVSGFSLRTEIHPGKYPVYCNWLSTETKASILNDFTVKNTRFLFGGNLEANFQHLDAYVKKTLFSREESQIDLLGGLRMNTNQIKIQDGSRQVLYDETTFQPELGYEFTWFPIERARLLASFLATAFQISGVDTTSIHSTVELRHKIRIGDHKVLSDLEIGLGHRRMDYELTTDTTSFSSVNFDQNYKSTFLDFNFRF